MKTLNFLFVLFLVSVPGQLAHSQNADTVLTRFTDRRSSLVGVTGSLYISGQSGGGTTTTMDVALNYLRFVANGFAIGLDGNLALVSSSGNAATLGIGPKAIYALGLHEEQVYPFFGFGYNLFTNGGAGPTSIGHKVKGSVGTIIEVAEHLGVPLEFTIGIPLGENSSFTTYELKMGVLILGY
jgi:hypothetical protein